MALRHGTPSRQSGIAAVEMAVAAALVLIVIFAVFEVARLFFVANALEEAARRGARVAAVCQINDPAIRRAAIFNSTAGDSSPIVPGLTTGNVSVQYVGSDGTLVSDPVADYTDIDAIRVTVQNYQHELIIPFLYRSMVLPDFSATIPRESLGVTREGYTTC
jgi:Flp pilus assembly protein TadG